MRKEAAPVTQFDPALKQLVDDMLETMAHEEGIGLAAPQIGISSALFVADVSPVLDPRETCLFDGKLVPVRLIMPLAVINPEFLTAAGETISVSEGCLSIPDLRAEVPRPEGIEIRFQDPQGQAHHLKADGILSRCIQHEFDHLRGVLFVDRITPARFAQLRRKLRLIEAQVRRDQASS